MAYRPLDLDPTTPPSTRWFISNVIEPLYFSDVHAILRLPLRSLDITAAGNFAVLHVLLAAIGGASTVLAKQSTKAKAPFMASMKLYYPWREEADGALGEQEWDEAVSVLFEEFRNPLTHSFGIDSQPGEHGALRPLIRDYKLKAIRLHHGDDKDGLPEEMIERLEVSPQWPFTKMPVTVSIQPHKKVVNIDRLYWGTRRMIERITADRQAMGQAERFLASGAKTDRP